MQEWNRVITSLWLISKFFLWAEKVSCRLHWLLSLSLLATRTTSLLQYSGPTCSELICILCFPVCIKWYTHDPITTKLWIHLLWLLVNASYCIFHKWRRFEAFLDTIVVAVVSGVVLLILLIIDVVYVLRKKIRSEQRNQIKIIHLVINVLIHVTFTRKNKQKIRKK